MKNYKSIIPVRLDNSKAYYTAQLIRFQNQIKQTQSLQLLYEYKVEIMKLQNRLKELK